MASVRRPRGARNRLGPPVNLPMQATVILRIFYRCFLTALEPDLQNVLRQFDDYPTIMPKLRSTYDGRLIY